MTTDRSAEVLAFAKANPLPRSTEGLALGMLDVAAIFKACNETSAPTWDKLSLTLPYRARAERYPGAFLSNPACLPNTSGKQEGYAFMASHTAGGFFAYNHYQESSLGPALLLCAFSPRTRKPSRSPKSYAKAALWLVERGLIASADTSGAYSLQEIADGTAPSSELDFFFLTIDLERRHIDGICELRTDLAARAVEFALGDDKPDLFSNKTRGHLAGLAAKRLIGRVVPTPAAQTAVSRKPRI
jgi:hypothetical protein